MDVTFSHFCQELIPCRNSEWRIIQIGWMIFPNLGAVKRQQTSNTFICIIIKTPKRTWRVHEHILENLISIRPQTIMNSGHKISINLYQYLICEMC